MKKMLLVLIVLLVPVFTFLEIWRVYDFKKLQKEIDTLQKEQVMALEENKDVLRDIAVNSSPKRIYDLAKNKLGLEKRDSHETRKIEFTRSDGF
ncbi:MAG: hypothetical protein JXR70_00720 [Spirochaetales bacterium]|nr:hypothetical protein [Spirochaetales bacterium]